MVCSRPIALLVDRLLTLDAVSAALVTPTGCAFNALLYRSATTFLPNSESVPASALSFPSSALLNLLSTDIPAGEEFSIARETMLRGPCVKTLSELRAIELAEVRVPAGVRGDGMDPKWAETLSAAVVNSRAQSATLTGKENGMGVFRRVFVVVMGVLLSIHCFR